VKENSKRRESSRRKVDPVESEISGFAAARKRPSLSAETGVGLGVELKKVPIKKAPSRIQH